MSLPTDTIVPGSRIAWLYEPCDPENGPSGELDVMEGTVVQWMHDGVILTDADDGSRVRISPTWLVDVPSSNTCPLHNVCDCPGLD